MPKERTPRVNRKPAVKDFVEKIEEVRQAHVDSFDAAGNPLAPYIVDALKDVAKRIGLKLPESV